MMDQNDPADFFDNGEQVQSRLGTGGRLSLTYLEDNSSRTAAWNRINPELAMQLLGQKDLAALAKMGEAIKEKPNSFEPRKLDYALSHEVSINKNTVQASNIAAFLEGSDPMLKDEVVVLSSHYDHVGIGRPDSTGDTIYNGADDDGSGTVGLLIPLKQ